MTANLTGTLVPDLELQPCKSSQLPSPQCTAARHGSRTAYVQGCRCPEARAACAAAQRSYETRRYLARGPLSVDAAGTRRRIQALVAIGWPQALIGERLGHDQRWVAQLVRRRYVFRHNALAVAALYDQLADHPGPSDRARTIAARAGWLPPLWWDDDTIDDPTDPMPDGQEPVIDQVAIRRYRAGDRSVKLTPAEKQAALAQLLLDGISLSAASAQLGLNATYARRYADAGRTVLARRDHTQTDHLEETA